MMAKRPPRLCSDKKKEEFFLACGQNLWSKMNRRPIELTLAWKKTFPPDAGVYVAFEDGFLVYVGETDCIKNRMHNLQNTRKHVLRRNLGHHHLKNQRGYERATTKKKFPPRIEQQVILILTKRLKVSVLPVSIGRKELEEWLIKKYKPRYNKKPKKQKDQ